MLDEDLLDEVRLSMVRGVGPRIRAELIAACGSATQVLSAPAARLGAARGVGPALCRAIQAAPTREVVSEMLAQARHAGIRPLIATTGEYPPLLREIHDPPPVLYCRGEVLPQDGRAIAIVGTRRASRYGLRVAEDLARGLAAAGVTVVSGLARGIDGAAHRAAIEAGGRTLAALAGGLSRIYPPEHAELADRVAAQGALLAEAPPPMPPMSGSFPQRNRIISGLSLGVVVIEAAERSGALITARHAAEQGRDAMAVPGPIDRPQSGGCHRLIQEGAKLVTCVDDILEEIAGPSALPPAAAPTAPPAVDPGTEPELWGAIGQDPIAIDTLVDTTGLPVERVLAGVSRLEAARAIERVSGVLVRRAR